MTTIATVQPPRKVGNGPPAEAPTLPEHRQKIVEAANAAYQQVLAERDESDRKLRDAMLRIEALVVQLDALKGVVNMMESTYLSTKLEMENRVMSQQNQRDDAVARAASLETTLANIYVMLRNTIAEPDGAADHVGEVR
jgi:hypothetical protein